MEWIIILHVAALGVFLAFAERAPLETGHRFSDDGIGDLPHRGRGGQVPAEIGAAQPYQSAQAD